MTVFVCAACSGPLTEDVQLSEMPSGPEFDGRVGPDGIRRAPATVPRGFYALDPEPWGPPFLLTDEPVAMFPGGPCASPPDGAGFLMSGGPRDTIVLHCDDAPELCTDRDGGHWGCCGLHGENGLNQLCPCGTAVGTRISECYTAYELHLDPRRVRAGR